MKTLTKMLCLAATVAAGTLGTSNANADDAVQADPPSGSVSTAPSGDATPVTTTSATIAPSSVSLNPTETGDSMTIYRSIHPNRPLLITGAAILVGTYVPTAVIQAAEGRPEDKDLYIPIAGPWITLANRNCETSVCENDTLATTLMVASGILQGVGAGLTIASFFIPEKVEAARIQAGPTKVQIVPSRVGVAGYGVGAVGTF